MFDMSFWGKAVLGNRASLASLALLRCWRVDSVSRLIWLMGIATRKLVYPSHGQVKKTPRVQACRGCRPTRFPTEHFHFLRINKSCTT